MPKELQVMLDPNRHVDTITPFTEGIYAWVADQGEWSHVKWLVEAPQGCPFEGTASMDAPHHLQEVLTFERIIRLRVCGADLPAVQLPIRYAAYARPHANAPSVGAGA